MLLSYERLVLGVAGVLSLLASAGRAQTPIPPEIGRLPVLDALPSGGACKIAPGNQALLRQGIARVVMFTDTATNRMVSVGVDAERRPRTLSAFASKRQAKRGETETVFATLDARGQVVRGNRSYFTTGVPARLSDDRKAGLLPADSARAFRLARALLRRCDP